MSYHNLFGSIDVSQGASTAASAASGGDGSRVELKATGTDGRAQAIPQPQKRGRGRPAKAAATPATTGQAAAVEPAPAPPAAAASAAASPNGNGAGKPSAAGMPAGGLAELRAIAYSALAKIAEREGDRNAMGPTAAAHAVKLHIVAEVNGHKMREEFAAELSVGHDTEKASSVTPPLAKVIGHIVGMLPAATRAKVLSDLPKICAANGGDFPEVGKEVADSVESMLKRLRATKTQKVKGSVSCRAIQPAAPGLRVSG